MRGLEAALLRYRILAFAVGTGLLILTAVGIPLQYLEHNKSVVEIVGPLHGFLYLVYLVFAFELWVRGRWPLRRLIPMILAGLVPLLAFYVEHRVTQRVRGEIAAARAAVMAANESKNESQLS
jgi:integral membrane protein